MNQGAATFVPTGFVKCWTCEAGWPHPGCKGWLFVRMDYPDEEVLLRWAEKNPPPEEWYDEEMDDLFEGMEDMP